MLNIDILHSKKLTGTCNWSAPGRMMRSHMLPFEYPTWMRVRRINIIRIEFEFEVGELQAIGCLALSEVDGTPDRLVRIEGLFRGSSTAAGAMS